MNILASTYADFTAWFRHRHGKGPYYAGAVYRAVFRRGLREFTGLPEFTRSPDLGRLTAREMIFPDCRITSKHLEDGVTKFVSRLADGEYIESVIIPAAGRTTLCLSSQAGCRMGCLFCATGRMGFKRNLDAEEMVWQIMAARFLLHQRVDNIVFMGMGEPLDNLDAVVRALHVITDQRGLDIASRHVTVSTAGHAEGMRALMAIGLPNLHVAVSVNTADDELRSRLMPINRKYPLSELRGAMNTLAAGGGKTVLIEYVLLAGVNDSEDDALNLARYLKGLPVRVNVIPFNSTPGALYDAPRPAQIRCFVGRLAAEKVFVRIRRPRGRSLMAACGQLGYC